MKVHTKLALAMAIGFSLSALAADKKFDIVDGSGKTVGQGTLMSTKKGLKIALDIKGEPGVRAAHLHEKGLCVGPKFETAGGHLNPHKKKHGHQNTEGPHLGDLGNIEIPANGHLKKEIILKDVTTKAGDPNSISTPAGVSLVIHAKPDDEKTDPAGAAGDRIYCGVISAAEEQPMKTENNTTH